MRAQGSRPRRWVHRPGESVARIENRAIIMMIARLCGSVSSVRPDVDRDGTVFSKGSFEMQNGETITAPSRTTTEPLIGRNTILSLFKRKPFDAMRAYVEGSMKDLDCSYCVVAALAKRYRAKYSVDRAERFIKDLRAPLLSSDQQLQDETLLNDDSDEHNARRYQEQLRDRDRRQNDPTLDTFELVELIGQTLKSSSHVAILPTAITMATHKNQLEELYDEAGGAEAFYRTVYEIPQLQLAERQPPAEFKQTIKPDGKTTVIGHWTLLSRVAKNQWMLSDSTRLPLALQDAKISDVQSYCEDFLSKDNHNMIFLRRETAQPNQL